MPRAVNKKFWQFRNLANKCSELILYGDISSSSWWGDEVTPREFERELSALGAVEEIVVRINSGGGDVFAAQAIGNLLEQHPAHVVAKIDGLCASAAVIVACHCNKVVAANDSTYMVHPVKMGIFDYADAQALESYLNALVVIRENILELYARKTGHSKEEAAAWMDATSWWTGAQAKEHGFVDELADDGSAVVENRSGVLFVNSVDTGLPFERTPQFVQDSLAEPAAAGSLVNKKEQKEDMKMDIKTADDLRNAYPDLVDQVEAAAARRGETQERQRIRDIEEMALPGSEAITNDAKFGKPISANDYAKAAMKLAKEQGSVFLDALHKDAAESGAGEVGQLTGTQDDFMNAIRSVGAKR